MAINSARKGMVSSYRKKRSEDAKTASKKLAKGALASGLMSRKALAMKRRASNRSQ